MKKKTGSVTWILFVSFLSLVLLFLFGGLLWYAFFNGVGKSLERDEAEENEFSYLRVNPFSGESTVGFVTLREKLESHEYLFYEDEIGNHILLSNFGEDQYQCIGSCYCAEGLFDEDIEKRRTATTLRTGMLYLMTAVTSIVAYNEAKGYFSEECKEYMSDICPLSYVRSEVEECEVISYETRSRYDEREGSGGEGGSGGSGDDENQRKKFFCQGFCVPKDFARESGRKKSIEFKCRDLKNDVEITLDPSREGYRKYAVNDFAQKIFEEEFMRNYCVEGSKDPEEVEGKGGLCVSSIESVFCVQTHPKTEIAQHPGNTDMVMNLKRSGRLNSKLGLNAMLAVDRGDFCDSDPYYDSPQSIGHEATISAPHMHAFAVDSFAPILENAEGGLRILDVGSGSGYLVSVFGHIVCPRGGKVVGLEVVPQLVSKSIKNLVKDSQVKFWMESGCIEVVEGDGWKGTGDDGFFDLIHVGAAADGVPKSLVELLAPGGRMIIPVGGKWEIQQMNIIDKDRDGDVHMDSLFGVRYVPLKKT